LYDPSKPWVSKVRDDGQLAADVVGYVDDFRPSGPSKHEAWFASRRASSYLNYLGIQDASRKRRGSTRTPGAWAGAVVITRKDGVYVTVSEEKWKKAKEMLSEMGTMIKDDPKHLPRKRLEQIRGFLTYVVRTYPPLKSYLLGLHQTIDGWRLNRDSEGWRIPDNQLRDWLQERTGVEVIEDTVAPDTVEAKPRLIEDIRALTSLMSAEKPILRRVRSKAGRKVVYTFGDASEAGFGRTLQVEDKVYYQFGQWSARADGRSSNWREAQNLLDGLTTAVKEHCVTGMELFIFTDNSTAESTFWKGYSKNKELSRIVLSMRKLEMEEDLVIHVIHVSGSRMINQGTDGLSRADQSTGVMQGLPMSDLFLYTCRLQKDLKNSDQPLRNNSRA